MPTPAASRGSKARPQPTRGGGQSSRVLRQLSNSGSIPIQALKHHPSSPSALKYTQRNTTATPKPTTHFRRGGTLEASPLGSPDHRFPPSEEKSESGSCQDGDGYGFPDIVSLHTEEYNPLDDVHGDEEWELRTVTTNDDVDPHDRFPTGREQALHARQAAWYKSLLVKFQLASSGTVHDLHTRLQILDEEHRTLQNEHHRLMEMHAKCKSHRQGGDHLYMMALDSVLREGVGDMVQSLKKDEKFKVLGIVAEACHPSDIDAQIALLQRYKRSRFDILSRLDEPLVVQVLTLLDVPEILNLRLTSKSHKQLTEHEEVWRSLCRQLEYRDWDDNSLEHLRNLPLHGWENLYQRLWRREYNWNNGLAQTVNTLQGHTSYVTSLKLREDVLISGSYDGTIRIWHLAPLQTNPPSILCPPLVLPAKGVSCLDYYAPEGVLVAGYHDIGRIQIWNRRANVGGHGEGVNESFIVSAGADKALIVWSWRTGAKLDRFGQQTKVCIGIQIMYDCIIAVTADGVIRTFSVGRREMVGQWRISELWKGAAGGKVQEVLKGRLKDVGGGEGGCGMVSWFEGQGRWMTVATRDMIIRLAWDQVDEDVPLHPSPPTGPLPEVPPSHISPPSLSSPCLQKLPILARSPRSPITPIGSRRPSSKWGSILAPSSSSPRKVPTSTVESTRTRSPLWRKSLSTPQRSSISPDVSRPSSSRRASTTDCNRSPLSASPQQIAVTDIDTPSSSAHDQPVRRCPLLSRPPTVLDVIASRGIQKGAMYARSGTGAGWKKGRVRVVVSTRIATQGRVDRHLHITHSPALVPTSIPTPDSGSAKSETTTKLESVPETKSKIIPITGAWSALAHPHDLNLDTPEKTPKRLVLDREKIIYGCTDGTIVVVGFMGDEYDLPH